MIDHLDNLLRQLFIDEIDEITNEAQVRFDPPDDNWRTVVANLTANALNIYLVDVRENRKLRSNERTREIQNGIVSETPAPRRIDCHYMISAWSPAVPSPAVESTVDEHALLYKATAALTNNEPLVPRQVYAPNPLPATFPPVIADAELPTALLPVEGFPKYAEFWGTMGTNNRWKPAVYLIVTLPVVLDQQISGPMVTTRITEYRQSGQPETAEVFIEIGGHVLLSPRPVAVGSGTVTVIGAGGVTVTLNDAAPFRVGDIVTQNNLGRTTITQIVGNDLTLSNALVGLAAGNTLRIANISPLQDTFRLDDVTGLIVAAKVLISGEDASNPGTTVTEQVVIQAIAAAGFVTLAATPARIKTYNLNVPPANAPVLRGFAAEAWVRLEDATGTPLQTTTTNTEGQFTFAGLREGNYTLRARLQGFSEAIRNIEVPSMTGNYDVQLM